MKWKIPILLIAACLLMITVAFVSKKSGNSDFDMAKEEIAMRKIAHEVLRYTGDSTSIVLPVNKISTGELQITFQSSFSFKPDSLVSIIGKVISVNNLPSDYIVNVLECTSKKVVFGYAMLGTEKNSIVPCLGRDQPIKNYCINIRFREKNTAITKNLYIGGIILLIAGLGMFAVQRKKNQKAIPVSEEKKDMQERKIENSALHIGRYEFYPEELFLIFNEEKTVLTIKESKLLNIFAAAPNQVIDRNRLQKEVWEDEGVIVGRSLDMFISKLRKKLEKDPGVRLANIHGKGYRLEITEEGNV